MGINALLIRLTEINHLERAQSLGRKGTKDLIKTHEREKHEYLAKHPGGVLSGTMKWDTKISGLKSALKHVTNESFQVGDHVIPDAGPHKGERHQVIGHTPDGRVNVVPIKKALAGWIRTSNTRYHLGAASAHAHQLTSAPNV